MKKRNIKSALSFILVMILLISFASFPVFATSEREIHITTAQDLLDLSASCRLDSYSEGLEVWLDQSIDMTGTDFIPIPSFNGTFYGGGNTISGLTITGTGESTGFFRRIEAEGVVMNLTVEGTLTSKEGSTRTGGIAGSNYGIILSCVFHGTLAGQEQSGGICGFNEGSVITCDCEGTVTGDSMTGGICGMNSGNLVGCRNYARVNTTLPEDGDTTTDISALTLLGLVTAEDVNTTVNTGGIAGYSNWIILRCENYGTTGYPAFGYNTGGIAGLQSNCISKCVNYGAVYGRNDVGGIVGQAEPYMLLEDRQTLSDEIKALSESFDDTMEHLKENSRLTAAYLEATGDSFIDMGAAYNNAAADAGYYDDLEETASESGVDLDIDNGNILDSTVSTEELDSYESMIDGGLDSASDAAGNVSGDKVKQIVNNAQENGDGSDAITETVSQAGDILDVDTSEGIEAYNTQGESIDETKKQAVADAVSDSLAEKADKATEVSGVTVSQETIDSVTDGDVTEDDYTKIIEKSLDEGPDALDNTTDYISEQRAERKSQEAEDDAKMTADVSTIVDTTNSLEDNIAGVGDSAAKTAKEMSDDLDVYNKHMTNALTMIANALSGNLGTNLYNDISELDEMLENNGKIMECENRGPVEGDTNVGGIAGSMSIESEYDLEGVISETLSSEGIFSNIYKTTCIITGCINRSDLLCAKSNCGGITGNQGLGYMTLNENYGNVTADGHYAGGVAGRSDAIINTCYSSCVVYSKAYTGGIAGLGTVIQDCISLSTIPDSVTTFRGAIAGSADVKATRSVDINTGVLAKTAEMILSDLIGDNEDTMETADQKCILGNYFVNSSVGGINGISYMGVAEPVSYETVMSFAGLPENLKTKSLIFRADGVTVKQLDVTYGGTVDPKDIPDVPAKEGYTGIWPDFDTENITDGAVIEAEYLPLLETVEGNVLRDGGQAVVLLQGSFPEGTTVHMVKTFGLNIKGRNPVESWTVAPEGAGTSSTASYKVRYQVPEQAGNHFILYVNLDGVWTETDYLTAGTYIEFEGNPGSTSFAITSGSDAIWIILICLGSSAAGASGYFLYRRIKIKKETGHE